MYLSSELLASFFGNDETTRALSSTFVQAFAISAPAAGLARIFAGVLQGAGETMKPFFAELVGNFGMLLGITYIGGIVLGYGVVALYFGIIAYGAGRFVLVLFWYRQEKWIINAFTRMESRDSV